ncbi:hypothetical protein CHL76_04180 [Marinococcus halophilus]|uniref:Metal-dependent hydrolase n=1 Tax=Marinococcus halophilus TaxID=1371 RepID=A0A510Y7L8_MARHA|nr:hypothetical protein [Marinococcus halophilus]OZT80985.1 hypothetical protein CHL76_04180 [Marinococcus halophilus]GEK59368.1 hypothetical protein MHA01_22730 [Marinococcus halophilus]
MIEILIEHVPSTLLHLLTGAAIMYIFYGSPWLISSDRLKIMAFGAIVLVPDIPKLFGNYIFHTLLTMPFIAAALAAVVRPALGGGFPKAWAAAFVTLGAGSMLIDFLGNGTQLLYPVATKNFSYPLLTQEWWVIVPLLCILGILIIRGRKNVSPRQP